jgi:hypothetical protein
MEAQDKDSKAFVPFYLKVPPEWWLKVPLSIQIIIWIIT